MQALATMPGNDRRIDAQHLAVELEDEVVQLPAEHDVAEIDVVERQEEPAPEQSQRRGPQCEQSSASAAVPAAGAALDSVSAIGRPEMRDSKEPCAAPFAMACAAARLSASRETTPAKTDRRSASMAT